MNINDIAAAAAYGATAPSTPKVSTLQELGERFAAVFDKADQSAQGFAAQHVDAQAVVEAMSEAELALQTAITIRDRVISAYQDILRMPI